LEQHLTNLLTPATPYFFNTLYDPFREGADFVRGYPFSLREGVPTAISHGLWLNIPDYDAPTQVRPCGALCRVLCCAVGVTQWHGMPEQQLPEGSARQQGSRQEGLACGLCVALRTVRLCSCHGCDPLHPQGHCPEECDLLSHLACVGVITPGVCCCCCAVMLPAHRS
jgi:hypothetical protein